MAKSKKKSLKGNVSNASHYLCILSFCINVLLVMLIAYIVHEGRGLNFERTKDGWKLTVDGSKISKRELLQLQANANKSILVDDLKGMKGKSPKEARDEINKLIDSKSTMDLKINPTFQKLHKYKNEYTTVYWKKCEKYPKDVAWTILNFFSLTGYYEDDFSDPYAITCDNLCKAVKSFQKQRNIFLQENKLKIIGVDGDFGKDTWEECKKVMAEIILNEL